MKIPTQCLSFQVCRKSTVQNAENVVVLPSEVVNIGKNGSFCYVLKDGVITRKDITTGVSSDDYVEVTEGIEAAAERIAVG